jgi:hypothetical protein
VTLRSPCITGIYRYTTVFKEDENVHYWKDSQCVLKWIQNHERCYITFVRSKITEVPDKTGGILRKHYRTGDNPADLPTRGLTVDQFKTAAIWWNGPHWLSDEEAIEELSFTSEVFPKPAKRIVDSTTLQVCVDNIESLILGEEDEKPVWAEDQKSMCNRAIKEKHKLKLDVSKKWIVMIGQVVDQTKTSIEWKQRFGRQKSTQVKNKMGLHSLKRRGQAVQQMVNRQQREHYSDEMIKAFKMGGWVGSELKNVCVVFDTEGLLRANVSLDSSVGLHIQGTRSLGLPRKSEVTKIIVQWSLDFSCWSHHHASQRILDYPDV